MVGPLTVYVLWHPAFAEGAALAEAVHDWLRTHDGVLSTHGTEVPVYFRSEPWSRTVNLPEVESTPATGAHTTDRRVMDGPFRPIGLGDTELNVIVALIDASLVNDPAWVRALYDLVSAGHNDVLWVPVELTRGFAALAPRLSRINAVRVTDWKDRADEGASAQLERRRRRLCRHLTQVLVRHLRAGRDEDLLPQTVFLSHAKADRERGVGVAEALQQAALQLGQVDPFLDSTSLPWADEWQAPMMRAAGSRAAGVVAVVSDAYASRYWCREEAHRARVPRRVDGLDDDAAGEHTVWWVQPVVAIDTLHQQWTHHIPELSGVPMVRWDGESATLAGEVLDRLFLDALMATVMVRYARTVAQAIADREEEHEVHYLAFNPEPFTLLQLLPAIKSDRVWCVYPGHGLMMQEEQRLKAYLGKRVNFVCVDDVVDRLWESSEGAVLDGPEAGPSRWGALAFVAASPPSAEELSALGYGRCHLREGVYRIGRALLRAGCRVAVRRAHVDDDVVDGLVDVASTALSHGREPDDDPPIVSLSARPEREVDPETRAVMHGRCGYRTYGADDEVADLDGVDPAHAALTALRRDVVAAARFTICLGGRLDGWKGRCPGVYEIAALAMELEKPIVPMALYGGASRRLVAWLLDDNPTRPPGGEEGMPAWWDAQEDVRTDLLALHEAMEPARTQAGTYHGLGGRDLHRLMTTDSVRVVRRLLARPVLAAWGGTPDDAGEPT